MQRIEKLIEMEIPRMQLPEELGEGPVWKVNTFKKRKPFKKK